MSLTKLSLDENNLLIPVQGEFGKWHPDWGEENGKPFFYSVRRNFAQLQSFVIT